MTLATMRANASSMDMITPTKHHGHGHCDKVEKVCMNCSCIGQTCLNSPSCIRDRHIVVLIRCAVAKDCKSHAVARYVLEESNCV